MDFVIFILAIASLIVGANFIIHQSEKIAIRLGIPEFVIGATFVAFGTSFPEMITSITATLGDRTDMAISNVIGSNILNISLILSFVLILIKDIKPNRELFAKNAMWAMLFIIFFMLMGIDGGIERFDGILLVVLMVAYVIFLSKETTDNEIRYLRENLNRGFGWIGTIFKLMVGFILVLVGAHFTIESASDIAKTFQISEWVIGIVLISFGGSMPELVISISATLKGKSDMAIGNIIGSNIANIAMVIGVSSTIKRLPIDLTDPFIIFNIATMFVATIILIYTMTRKLYNRLSGICLFILLILFLKETVDSLHQ